MNKSSLESRSIFAWCLYDFANTSFTTLVVTFIYSAYFTKAIAENEIVGTALWSRGITISGIIVALLSPMLGALADRGGYRKLFLLVATILCVIATTALYFVMPGQTTLALTWFIVANISFEMGCVFYNAFLPDIAAPQKIGRVSAYGWALGYGGGLLCMFIALFGFVNPDQPWFGFSKEVGENIRATNLLVAFWFALFSIPIFLFVNENTGRASVMNKQLFTSSLIQLKTTFHEIQRYRQIIRLLIARLFYNDGLIMIFAFGGIYAVGTFGFSVKEIIIFGIVLNITAGLGAFAMGFIDDFYGGKKTIIISVFGLTMGCLIGVLAFSKTVFWVAGVIIGFFAGPNQSASRSLIGRFIPQEKENEFYGFFAFSGKATAFLGPLLLGVLTELFQSQRVGMSIILVFLIIGGSILMHVNEKEGIYLSRHWMEP
ncbi:MAG: MFS transporter [Thermodesulfobacteriota bacterium]|nr:MFS transporter [Thermodesulfobacteriota bacterium]